MSVIYKPALTDVLLGRGVGTNRHPGNENYRAIVSQHVDVYVNSTKKQKTMISRSIVNRVKTELNPPGRFLEKNADTGLWEEVGDKRALEKTAQALRDGASTLRKQLLEDMSDPTFLDALFDENGVDCPSSIQKKTKNKKLQQRKRAASMATVVKSSGGTSRPKKQRLDPVPVQYDHIHSPQMFEYPHQTHPVHVQAPFPTHQPIPIAPPRGNYQMMQHQQMHTTQEVGPYNPMNNFTHLPVMQFHEEILTVLNVLEPALPYQTNVTEYPPTSQTCFELPKTTVSDDISSKITVGSNAD